ncbi:MULTISPECIES: hypothetical protein [Providencia]|uniref:Secreted protein n=2 Tax=Providencia stuartii TaxID=588 RepID=A0AA86YQB1_PROST|nr:hypothetical protein [Providencia stuartii]EDU61055.1 hypothetical protein PROSTU_01036 [Providencia stuartii ATCC 25827]MTC81660.1 hypothetical protein [Providencia stuartii]
MKKNFLKSICLVCFFVTASAGAVTWNELDDVKTSDGGTPLEGCDEYIECNVIEEKGRYLVIQTRPLPRDCMSGGLYIVNTKKKLANFIPNISNCDIVTDDYELDLGDYSIDIAPVNGFVFITKDHGKTEISSVELP